MLRDLEKIKVFRRMFGPRGLWLALKAKLASHSIEIEFLSPEVNKPLHLRLKSSDINTYQKIFFESDYDFPVGKSPKIIVDAGANIGFASIFLAEKYPAAKIYAIEPESSNFALLKKNTSSYTNITPIRAALWKERTLIDIVDPGIGPWGFQVQDGRLRNGKPVVEKVEALTIPDLMKTHQIDFIDILKIDIEGGEKEVFEHANSWIEKVGSIMIELHDRMKIGCSRSFYLATREFAHELHKGENIFLARPGWSAQTSA